MNLYHMDDNTHLIAEPAEDQGRYPDPLRIKLGICAVVRHWGTTRGRGELCIDGPTDKTKVDPEPEGVELTVLHVRRIIPVTAKARAAWLRKLKS